MKTYIIKIEGPGSEGHLEYIMDESEYKAFNLFVKAWNDANQCHSAPYIRIEEHENS